MPNMGAHHSTQATLMSCAPVAAPLNRNTFCFTVEMTDQCGAVRLQSHLKFPWHGFGAKSKFKELYSWYELCTTVWWLCVFFASHVPSVQLCVLLLSSLLARRSRSGGRIAVSGHLILLVAYSVRTPNQRMGAPCPQATLMDWRPGCSSLHT